MLFTIKYRILLIVNILCSSIEDTALIYQYVGSNVAKDCHFHPFLSNHYFSLRHRWYRAITQQHTDNVIFAVLYLRISGRISQTNGLLSPKSD